MKKFTTATAINPEAIVAEAWQEVGASFERFGLTAGIAALSCMILNPAVDRL